MLIVMTKIYLPLREMSLYYPNEFELIIFDNENANWLACNLYLIDLAGGEEDWEEGLVEEQDSEVTEVPWRVSSLYFIFCRPFFSFCKK